MDTESKVLENLTQELRRGSLVLSVLLCTEEKAYGYSLIGMLKARGMDAEQNTLYPLLRRLESQGLLESSWDTSESRPRRYYAVSDSGRAVRSGLLEEWKRINRSIAGMEESHEVR